MLDYIYASLILLLLIALIWVYWIKPMFFATKIRRKDMILSEEWVNRYGNNKNNPTT
jgi:hypothetical protein